MPIRVTVEFIPNGDEDRKREIGRMEIVNTGENLARPLKGDYRAMLVTTAPNGDVHASNRTLLDFDRLRWNVWGLIYAALEVLGPAAMAMDDESRSLG